MSSKGVSDAPSHVLGWECVGNEDLEPALFESTALSRHVQPLTALELAAPHQVDPSGLVRHSQAQ